jgi:ABC-type branched-subunit amino acid transport system substrate-binding protein
MERPQRGIKVMSSKNFVRLIACTTVALLVVGASGAGASTTAGQPTKTASCPGTPVKYGFQTSVTSATATTAVTDTAFKVAKAALKAVNKNCEAGVPIELVLCDEKGDPNEAAACARKLIDAGVVGVWDDGINAPNYSKLYSDAGVPETFVNALGTPQIFGETSKNVFGLYYPPVLVNGYASAAASVGAKSLFAMVLDLPTVKTFSNLLKVGTEALGLKYAGTAFIPQDAVDQTSYVAQALDSGADAIAIIAMHEPIVKALKEQGKSPQDIAVIAPGNTLTQTSIDNMGKSGNGILAIGGTTIADRKNPGTKQFYKELKAAKATPNEVADINMVQWSAVHEFAKLVKSLNGAPATKEAVKAALGTWIVDEPQLPQLDYAKEYYPKGTAFGDLGLHLYGDSYVLQEVKNGKLLQISKDFIKTTEKENVKRK